MFLRLLGYRQGERDREVLRGGQGVVVVRVGERERDRRVPAAAAVVGRKSRNAQSLNNRW
jgi:hypothetical protein